MQSADRRLTRRSILLASAGGTCAVVVVPPIASASNGLRPSELATLPQLQHLATQFPTSNASFPVTARNRRDPGSLIENRFDHLPQNRKTFVRAGTRWLQHHVDLTEVDGAVASFRKAMTEGVSRREQEGILAATSLAIVDLVPTATGKGAIVSLWLSGLLGRGIAQWEPR